MKTTFEYRHKTYQVDIDATDWWNNKAEKVIKLPNGDLVRLISLEPNINVRLIKEGWLEAVEVDGDELTFQSLLEESDLPDTPKTRKLWGKCYDMGHSGGLSEMKDYWYDLVDLLQD